jgi:hypothetical protein
MLNSFNRYFIASGSIFPTNNNTVFDLDFLKAEHNLWSSEFAFKQITSSDVCLALKALDVNKSSGPDHIAPLYLKLAAELISSPLTYLFNLSLSTNIIPRIWKSAFVVPLPKGGDPSLMDNYRPISKLCILSKVLENLVSNQLAQYLNCHNILSINQSGFRKGHSTTTAVLKVMNDIVESLDNKQHCACVFIDLSKAFDTVDHIILLDRLRQVGLSENVILWFINYLQGRTQCVQVEGVRSDFLEIIKGVPQGSVLGPLLFSIYINCLDFNIVNAKFHFYADDTIVYCSAPSKQQSVASLQSVFDIIQNRFCALKLVLNIDKTKCMLFTNSRTSENPIVLQTYQGSQVTSVLEYKYLGIIIDNTLRFGSHIKYLQVKLKKQLGFYFRNKSCFSFKVKKEIVSAMFLPVLDYGDVIYQHAPSYLLLSLDALYHGALRFITGCKFSTHHCELYKRVAWPSLSIRRKMHWYLLIYKAILGCLPIYLCCLIQRTSFKSYSLRSQSIYNLCVPFVRTELGKTSFKYAATSDWNLLQKEIKLQNLVSYNNFKSLLCNLERNQTVCDCF